MKPSNVLGLILVASILAGCGQDPSSEPENKPALPPPSAEAIENAPDLALSAGEIAEIDVNPDNSSSSSAEFALSTSSSSSVSLSGGATTTYTQSITTGDTLYVASVPVIGDLDVEVWRGPTRVGSSVKGAGYVDRIFLTPSISSTTSYSIRLICYGTTACGGSFMVSVGDNSAFSTSAAVGYVNQRSFRSASTTGDMCVIGTTQVIGECMCSNTTAAEEVIHHGKRRISEVRAVAEDLFRNTNDPTNGAAIRANLRARLRDVYGFASCVEVTASSSSSLFSSIRSELRQGHLLLLRSSSFFANGHYTRVKGYTSTNVLVDDPYGRWLGSVGSYTANTIDQSSTTGRGVSYVVSSLSVGGTSLITCQ